MRFDLGALSIDAVEYASHGNAILGIRGSGKTYTATGIAERLFDAGIPFFAFDPIGVWRWLRVPGAGRGYPVVVAGGQAADLPLTVAGAPELVRAALHDGVSLVFDLFDLELSKADWRRIVTSAVRVMLHENHAHGLRHVFLEEAAEFVPQRPVDFAVYGEIEKLARMGGNVRLGYTLINQRSQEVSKAILELCENVFLHRQRGKNALENLDKWLQVAGAAQQGEIMASLPELPQGQCWAWLGGDVPQPPTLVTVPAKSSFHPDRRVVRDAPASSRAAPVDVGAFVAAMAARLSSPAEAAGRPAKAARTSRAELEAAYQQGHRDGYRAARDAAEGRLALARGKVEELAALLSLAVPEHQARAEAPGAAAGERRSPARLVPRRGRATNRDLAELAKELGASADWPVVGDRGIARDLEVAGRPDRRPGASSVLGKGERLVLTVLAQHHPARVPASRAAAIAGYSVRTSTWRNILSKLRQAGLIEDGPEPFAITPAGREALGPVEPLPTGAALLDHWAARVGKGERETLRALAALPPGRAVASAALAERAGYDPATSTWRNIVSRLRTLGLIEGGKAIALQEALRGSAIS